MTIMILRFSRRRTADYTRRDGLLRIVWLLILQPVAMKLHFRRIDISFFPSYSTYVIHKYVMQALYSRALCRELWRRADRRELPRRRRELAGYNTVLAASILPLRRRRDEGVCFRVEDIYKESTVNTMPLVQRHFYTGARTAYMGLHSHLSMLIWSGSSKMR